MTSPAQTSRTGALSRDVRSASRPDPITGWVGTLYAIALYTPYAYFLSCHRGGGSLLPPPLKGTLLGSEHERIGRDFYDGLLMMALVLGAMAAYDRLSGWRRRLLPPLLLGSAAVFMALATGLWQTPLLPFGHDGWSTIEMALAGSLGAFLALFVLEVSSSEHRQARQPCLPGKAFRTGLGRWLAGLMVLGLLTTISLTHPYFARSGTLAIFRLFVGLLFLGFVVFGLPWAALSEWLRHGRDDPKKDMFFPSLCALVFGLRSVLRYLGLSKKPARFRALMKKRWMRFSLLDLIVKGFFFPIMLGFLYVELGAVARGFSAMRATADGMNAFALYDVVLHTVLIVDVIIGAIGYIASSRWLRNKSVSVDPTAGGWAVALFCYPPFNSSAGTLFPYAQGHGSWPEGGALWTAKLLMLGLFAIYVWCTVVFGLRFSNLTNRGIIDHGPYRFVRHPAYISKALAWFVEYLPAFQSPWHPITLVLFSGIYALRALTEERHLMADPAYRAYCKKVRWRFIPGIV